MLKTLTLDDCLRHYISNEKLDKDNRIECNLCYRKNQSSKQTVLWRTPKILIIHLKRFMVNNTGILSQKINNMITYPIENLDIAEYIDKSSSFINKSKYNLFAINCHHNIGIFNTINFGHYTSMVKNRFDNKWYNFDDNNMIEEIKDIDTLINRKAYMLFYYRIN